ncbi:MAG: hypothetical protein M3066_06865 [Actinomycetota bacterium]|nr:hypothetical protein [Actinomycetota bacterium]
MSAPPLSDSTTLPRHARRFVALFLAALVVCAVAPVNAWPFSSWKLFSSLRTDKQTSWQAVAVDATGREQDYPIASIAHGYRGFARIVSGFPKRSAAGRDAVCAAWLTGATKRIGPGTDLLRIYRLDWLVSRRQGDRAAAPRRTLDWICDQQGLRAAS